MTTFAHAAGLASGTANYSMPNLFWQAETFVKAIMLFLLCLSIWSWSIILSKRTQLRVNKKEMHKFRHRFWRTESITTLYKEVRGQKHLLAEIFSAGIDELEEILKDIKDNNYNFKSAIARIDRAMESANLHVLGKLQRRVNMLATVASSTPFIGLLGTVWGIMHSFQSIAVAKNANLAVVAPGIAEALLATALGLIAAIPALLFYNKFTSDINELAAEGEEFKLKLSTLIIRSIEKQGADV